MNRSITHFFKRCCLVYQHVFKLPCRHAGMEREIKHDQVVRCTRSAGAFSCTVLPKARKDVPFPFSRVKGITIGTDFSGDTTIDDDVVEIRSANMHAICSVSISDGRLWCNKVYRWER